MKTFEGIPHPYDRKKSLLDGHRSHTIGLFLSQGWMAETPFTVRHPALEGVKNVALGMVCAVKKHSDSGTLKQR